MRKRMKGGRIGVAALVAVGSLAVLLTTTVLADQGGGRQANSAACRDLPSYGDLTEALESVVVTGTADNSANGGLNNDMWATLVNREGTVCAVTRSGDDVGDQWLGSRVISAQKANTANAFSLPDGAGGVFPGLALSTANLNEAVQPGGSLFGLQESNPVDPSVAYAGNAANYGNANDPMVGKKIGGVNVFGGGLGLYDGDGNLLGAIGLSGDTSCADHFIAWKVRDALGLDNPPTGVAGGTDNIIFGFGGGFGHPHCLDPVLEDAVLASLPTTGP